MTTILTNLINSLQLTLGDAYTDEVAAYAQQAVNAVLGGFVITEDEGIIDDQKIKNGNYWAGTDRKGCNAKKSCAVVSVKGTIDKFFEVFDSLCGNKTEAQKAAEQQAAAQEAEQKKGGYKSLYDFDIDSAADDADVPESVTAVPTGSNQFNEIQKKAEDDILKPIMDKMRSQLSGKGIPDDELDEFLDNAATDALANPNKWATTSNNYTYTINSNALIDLFKDAVKAGVKSKGYEF